MGSGVARQDGSIDRTHKTFEAYCQERWGFSRKSAFYYVEASKVAENVQSIGQNQPSYTQAAEMHVLTPEQQRSVAGRVDFPTTTVAKLKTEIDRERCHQTSYKSRGDRDTTCMMVGCHLLYARRRYHCRREGDWGG
jgi:hypothetical protein